MKRIEFYGKYIDQPDGTTVSKAFLITGGTKKERSDRATVLHQIESSLMYANYEGKEELAVIFSAHHADFEGMTFEKAKKLAGSNELDCSEFGREQCFGIIDLEKPFVLFPNAPLCKL